MGRTLGRPHRHFQESMSQHTTGLEVTNLKTKTLKLKLQCFVEESHLPGPNQQILVGACICNIVHLRQLVLQKSGGDSLLAALYSFRGGSNSWGAGVQLVSLWKKMGVHHLDGTSTHVS